MPCRCEQLAPCRAPELITLPTYSGAHAVVLNPMPYEYEPGLSPEPVLVGMTLLFVALSRHFQTRPLCVPNLVGRDAGLSDAAPRPARSEAARRPCRLVLSARERTALTRVRDALRTALRWAPAPARRSLPLGLAEAPRPVRS